MPLRPCSQSRLLRDAWRTWPFSSALRCSSMEVYRPRMGHGLFPSSPCPPCVPASPCTQAQKRPDVRVVPRNAAPPRGAPFRGPPMGFMPPMMGMPPMMPQMMMQQQQMRGGAPPPGRWQSDRFQGQQQQQKPAAISTAKL